MARMRGATSATFGSLKCPSMTSSQPVRGTTSGSRKATNSVAAARNPKLRAAATPWRRSRRSTVTRQRLPRESGIRTGRSEPSSTTITVCPRSADSSRDSSGALLCTGTITVTSSSDGSSRGRGLATPESRRRLATRADAGSVTSR